MYANKILLFVFPNKQVNCVKTVKHHLNHHEMDCDCRLRKERKNNDEFKYKKIKERKNYGKK